MIYSRIGLVIWTTITLPFSGFTQEQDIRAEKPLVMIPDEPNHWLWLWLLMIPALAVAGWIFWRWWKNRPSPEVRHADIALNQLGKIHPLITAQSPEPLVNEASSVLRTYIEKRFSIKALSQSTEEFLQNLRENPKYSNIQTHQQQIDDFLLACDKVKFGRGAMNHEDRENLISIAQDFIRKTSGDKNSS